MPSALPRTSYMYYDVTLLLPCYVCMSLLSFEAYEITLMSVYLCVPPIVATQRTVSVPMSSPPNNFVFYAVRVISNESKRFVLTRTSCFLLRNLPLGKG